MEKFEDFENVLYELCETPIEFELIIGIVYFIFYETTFYKISFLTEKKLYQKILEDEPKLISQRDHNQNKIGIRIEYKDDFNDKYLDIFPQLELRYYYWGEDDYNLESLKYRLDFGIFLYDKKSKKNIKKFDIECDGYDFHSLREKIIKDNKRDFNIINYFGFFTVRFLGTQIMKFDMGDKNKILEGLFDMKYPSTTNLTFKKI